MQGYAPISFDFYLCQLSDLDADNFIVCQPDYYGEKGGAPLEALSPYGFMGCPLNAEVDAQGEILAAAPMLVGWEGGKGFCIPLLDKRSVEKLPKPKPGESFQYGAAANFVRCHADGAVTMYTTTDGTLSGQAAYARVRPDGFDWIGPWGYVKLDATGFHVRDHSGARFDLGGIGGIPAPLDALGAYGTLSAPLLKLEAAILKLGTGPGAEPVVKAASLVSGVLGPIANVLTQLGAPSAYVAPSGGGPCVPSAGLVAAISAAETAISGALLTISSRSTSAT